MLLIGCGAESAVEPSLDPGSDGGGGTGVTDVVEATDATEQTEAPDLPLDDVDTSPGLSCTAWCEQLQSACTGAAAQFPDVAACLGVCWALPPGVPGDAEGHSLACRMTHAALAASDEGHCAAAGPSGDGVCGAPCESYCGLADAICASSPDCPSACATYEAAGELSCRLDALVGAAGTPGLSCATAGQGCGGSTGDQPSCETYCEAVTIGCVGPEAQYESEAACVEYCATHAQLPLGHTGDPGGNSVGCRTTWALAGQCDVAGPTGAGVCGELCEVYCQLADANCHDLFTSPIACAVACGGIASGESAGDTIQCRIHALGLAGDPSAGDPAVHCASGGPAGGEVCVHAPSCEEYCALTTTACTGPLADYADEADCLAYCSEHAALPIGADADESGNTLGCRIHYAGLASLAAEKAQAYCPAAGKTGGDLCGSWCTNYCHLALKNCALFADLDACVGECKGYDVDGTPGDAGGDTVQCRLHHLGLAPAQCENGGPDGGAACTDDPPPAPACGEYCAAVTSACVGAHAQFGSHAQCMTHCTTWSAWPAGLTGDETGNTIGCRLTHALAAAADPAGHCPAAGPSGGGICGAWCEVYCELASKSCPALFASDDACVAACSTYPATGAALDVAGDSVQCRIHHLGLAGGDPVACAAGAADGGGVCVADEPPPPPTCGAYCTTISSACAGASAQYTSQGECMAVCGDWSAWTPGKAGDTTGNTIGCRLTHALSAVASPVTECAIAGPSGGGVCGGWCEVYCDLAAGSCPVLFTSQAACASACAGYPATGASGDVEGDTVQCRVHHLTLAGGDPVGCASGAPDGGGVCVDDEPPAPTCDEYCATVTSACTGALTQYADLAACQTYCTTWGAWPVGGAATITGNTLTCRMNQALAAVANPAGHCAAAGPSGGGVCGGWCDVYCGLAIGSCPALFSDAVACASACGAYPATGTAGDVEGDTVQCRIYHLGLAGGDAAHCPHGAPDGGGVCVTTTPPVPPPTCAEYCTAVTANCVDPYSQYVDGAECASHCAAWSAWPKGEGDDTGGNTLGCRHTHAVAAATESPATHCPAAGPSGGGTCGAWCDVYCHVALKNCKGGNTLFPDVATCGAACATLATTGLPGDTAGDSVQCRIQHLGIAASNWPSNAAAHCGYGDPDGGGVCVEATAVPGTCAEPLVAGPAPWTTSGDTSAFEGEHAVSAGACPGLAGAAGAGTPDVSTVFSPAVAGSYVFTLSGLDGALVIGSACEALDGTCLGASLVAADEAGTVTLSLDAGAEVVVVVDGAGAYALGIELVPPPSCAEYCSAVTASCVDGDAQYADEAACLTYCAELGKLPLGATGDAGGNSVGCRTHHAGLAAADAVHCAAAGPTGGGVCGSWCDTYCHLALANCALFGDTSTCLTACAGLPASGKPGAITGDTVQCRIHELGLAGADPALCPGGAVDGGAVCQDVPGNTCETAFPVDVAPFVGGGDTAAAGLTANYGFAAGDCVGEPLGWAAGSNDVVYAFEPTASGVYTVVLYGGYDSSLYVVTDCDDIAEGCMGAAEEIGVAAIETLNLLLEAGTTYYVIVDGWSNLENAAGAFGVSITPQPPPSAECWGYCTAVAAACTGEHAQYAGDVACSEYCEIWAQLPAGEPGETAGNTAGCRTTWAEAVIDDPSTAATGCRRAGPTGGNTCGSWCEVYCALAMTNCTGADALFDTEPECLAACTTFGTSGSPNDVTGDTVQCRIFHLGLAGIAPGETSVASCPNGGPDGGITCVATPPAGPPTYNGAVQPILAKRCAPCHSTLNLGSHNAVASYAETQLESSYCLLESIGECFATRIENGTMPGEGDCTGDPVLDAGNPACVTADEQAVIKAWIAAGMPEG